MGRQASRTIFISEYQQNTYRRFLGKRTPVRVIYPGVPDVFFRKRVCLDSGRVITVCRLAPEKNLRFALRVMAEVQRRVDAEYIIVGDGPERDKLEKYARRLGVEVTFLGRVKREDLPAVYSDADLFLLLSKTETFGLVFAEAMACGLPVVALRRGAVPEVVGDGGVLCGEEVKEVADAVIRLLKDRPLRERLSEKARRRALRFTLKRFLEDHEGVYREVINI
ncbi:MAG: glycosyltransferase [Aquificota bacterium]|nr:glycosyltransferase [Aquificota bacterium]